MRIVDFEMFKIEGRMEAVFSTPEDEDWDEGDDDFYRDKRFMMQISRDCSRGGYWMSKHPAAPSDNEEGWTGCPEAFEL